MEEKLSIAKEMLAKYGQEHVLNFYQQLSKEEQNKMFDEFLTMDYKQ